MRDFLGEELGVGDKVAFIKNGYRSLILGVIVKLNDRKLTILEVTKFRISETPNSTTRYPNEVIKVFG